MYPNANARALLDDMVPVRLPADKQAGMPPGFSGREANRLLDELAEAEAACRARRVALAGMLGVEPAYAVTRDLEKLREDFAAAHAARYAVVKGDASGWDPANHKLVLGGAFGYTPTSHFHWHRAKKKS